MTINRPDIPVTGGSYILWLKLGRKRRITIGRLGEQLFRPGYYAYCGSAVGPGGLKARLGHHCRRSERPRWHIDYLKNVATVQEIWFSTAPENLEHRWASTLSRVAGAVIPVNGFGASDCGCPTHLICFPHQPDFSHMNNLFPEIDISRLTL